MPNQDTATVEALRTFAFDAGEIQFAHLCTAAINGEEWAVKRIAKVLRLLPSPDYRPGQTEYHTEAKLDIIRATDTTRPDGTVPRGGIVV